MTAPLILSTDRWACHLDGCFCGAIRAVDPPVVGITQIGPSGRDQLYVTVANQFTRMLFNLVGAIVMTPPVGAANLCSMDSGIFVSWA